MKLNIIPFKKAILFIFLLMATGLTAQDKLTAKIGFDTYPDDKLDDVAEDLTENLRELLIDEYNIFVPSELIESNLEDFEDMIIPYNGKATLFIKGELKRERKKKNFVNITLNLYEKVGEQNSKTQVELIGQRTGRSVAEELTDSRGGYDKVEELLKKLLGKYRIEPIKIPPSNQQKNKTSGDYRKMRGTRGDTLFPMGSTRRSDGKKRLVEEEVHLVEIFDFEIGRNEVTNLQYCEFLNDTVLFRLLEEEDLTIRDLADFAQGGIYITPANKYAPKPLRPNEPVVMVSWDGARLYAKWLSQRKGKTYRLPTEAEWEYAASMNQYEDGRWDNTMFRYSGDNKIKKVAWFKGNSQRRIHAVGERLKNNNGIYNMTGNVAEWCLDDYEENEYKQLARQTEGFRKSDEPLKHFGVREKVVRGGSFKDPKHYCRNAFRGHRIADTKGKYDDVGFRLVRVKT